MESLNEKQDTNSYYAAELYMPRQVMESIALTESTLNPETFFSRYELALERASILAGRHGDRTGCLINGRQASELVRQLNEERDARTIAFIKRCNAAGRLGQLTAYVEAKNPNMSRTVKQYYEQLAG